MEQNANTLGKIDKNLVFSVLVAVIVVLFGLLIFTQETSGENRTETSPDLFVFEIAASYPNASKLIQAEIYIPIVFMDYPRFDLELGEICSSNEQCKSGYCNNQDNVCCDSACSGECESCLSAKTGGVDGYCGDVIDNTDPDSECLPYWCRSGACQETCTTNSDCQTGYTCDVNTCVPLLPDGDPCLTDTSCQSGYCDSTDQVCCNIRCDGNCEACLASKTGGVDGICDYILPGTDPDDECELGVCDGYGFCQEP
jgi:hypothetical protein